MVYTANADADFALAAESDDMAPMFRKGDYLLCKRCDMIQHGELGVFNINGKMHAKQLYLKSGECRLISLNLDTPAILIRSIDELNCVGKILGKAETLVVK